MTQILNLTQFIIDHVRMTKSTVKNIFILMQPIGNVVTVVRTRLTVGRVKP